MTAAPRTSPAPTTQDGRPGPRTVLILGANGRLGAAAAHAFANAGWKVLAQVRREPSPDLPAQVTPVQHPLDDTAALVHAAAGASVVVHAVNPIYTRWEAEALPALHHGLAVAEALRAHFMLPGNVYNFGAAMPALLRENTVQRPTTRKGEIRVAMEQLIEQRAAAGGFTASVLRAGDFFGSGTGTWLDLAMAKSLRKGKLVYPGPLDVPHAWAYLPDLARAFVAVAQQTEHAPFRCWHFEGHTLTGAQMLDAIEAAANELKLTPKPDTALGRGGMPWGVIGALGLVVPMMKAVAQMAYLWRVPHALEGQALAALMGPRQAATPMPEAMRAALLAM
jgi:nucleoside-diphosphate-sugar epimerase